MFLSAASEGRWNHMDSADGSTNTVHLAHPDLVGSTLGDLNVHKHKGNRDENLGGLSRA